MKIGDEWLTNTMLINTLSRNQKLTSQIGNSNNEFTTLFMGMLQDLFFDSDLQTSLPSQVNNYVPNNLIGDVPITSERSYMPPQESSGKNEGQLSFQPISVDKLNQVLGGKLKGFGEVFVQVGKRYNINPRLIAAIAQHESANGKSRAAIEKNNIAGMMGRNGLKSYATIEDSISDMARNLSKNYLGNGLNNIASIGAKYAPIGAENDPTDLNNHWVSGVTKFFNHFSA